MPADGAEIAVAFGRLLRGVGLDVPLRNILTFVEAIGLLGIDRRDGVYWAARATLVRRREDIPPFDAAFTAFWLQRDVIVSTVDVPTPAVLELAEDEPEEGAEVDSEEMRPARIVRASPTEVLRHKDFAEYTDSEFDQARRMMATLRLAGATRRSRRRHRSTRGRGRSPDVRRTVRRALRTGGVPLDRAFLDRAERPRRVVLLCDVSGSMEPYTRALLRFLHAAVVGRGRVEAFALGTRLTRLTRELSSHDPDAALAAAGRAVPDWSGGTRLGETIKEFNDRWGVRGVARGAVVVVLSDGWDRGDPVQLATEMARLRRVAYRVVWVNPLMVTPGFAPLARGMAAALPFVDELVEGHSVASLGHLAEVVSKA